MYNKQIDLLEFIPNKVKCGKKEDEYPLYVTNDNIYITFSYFVAMNNNAKREHSLIIPRYIKWDNETFEVLGLLQAEMGKTNNGCVVFCNHEYQLINKVMIWFEKELELMCNEWRVYIKVNINEPQDEYYKKEIEEKVINYWLNKTQINPDKKHPKTVSYIKNTKNKKLKFYDYGTLIIEHKSNLFSQIVKRYVQIMSYKILYLGESEISYFMRGIIAGEGTVEIHKESKHYRVHITANNKSERDLYQNCLSKLGICITQYDNYKEMIISKRENNVKLLKQRLMCLSHEKYSKFLNMMMLYPNISKETGYFSDAKEVWNKIPQEKVNNILELYKSGIKPKDIVEKVGVSKIKVNRVLKANNLGKRIIKTSEQKRMEIAKFAQENPVLTQKKIAEYFDVHESVVRRACSKYII